MRTRSLAIGMVLSVLLVPAAAAGQTEVSAPRNVVSANPFLLIATWFNAEYERQSGTTTSFGVRASTLELDDDVRYSSGRAFLRYYPNGALRQFFVGLDFGVTAVSDVGDDFTALAAGFELGYNWLLGARQNLYVSLGMGMDRLFASDLGDASAAIPTVRLVNIGFTF